MVLVVLMFRTLRRASHAYKQIPSRYPSRPNEHDDRDRGEHGKCRERAPLRRRQARSATPFSRQLQYVARPPDRSNTDAVLNAQSSELSQRISDAASSGRRKRFIGIFDSM